MLERDFKEFIYKRCEKALIENETYVELQSKCTAASINKNITQYEEVSCQLEAIAEELCYIKGFKDAFAILGKSNYIQ